MYVRGVTQTLANSTVNNITQDDTNNTGTSKTTVINGTTTVKDTTKVEKGGLEVKDGGTLITEKLVLNQDVDATLTGDDSGKGHIIAKSVEGNGRIILHDPAWKDGVAIEGASTGVYQSFDSGKVDAILISRRNSYVKTSAQLFLKNQQYFYCNYL